MLQTGDTAPDFALPNAEGKTVRLTELLERGPVVLYFYPSDFTPGCTKQACMFRDIESELAEAGLQVVGVSPQDSESHKRFAERYDLAFELLADEAKKAINAYGVDGPLGIGVRRATFLIGTDGRIRDTITADLRIARHEEFARRAMELAKD